MIDEVHLTRAGIQGFDWDADLGQYVKREIPAALEALRSACHIDPGVILGDIFRAVERDQELVRFLAAWAACDVDALHEEARRPTDQPSAFTSIEIVKYFESTQWGAQETIAVSAIGEPDERGATRYAIDFTPASELVDLPVRLRPAIEIRKDREKLGEARSTFTLLEVLGEIYWEIGFHGSPEQRDQVGTELLESVREIQEGRADLIPWEPPEEKVN
jgi:hypothetical protein